MEKYIILSTDCSFRFIGWSITEYKEPTDYSIVSYGCIKTKICDSKLKTFQDLSGGQFLYNELRNKLEELKPEKNTTIIFAFELPIGSKSHRAARTLGITTGVLASLKQEAETKGIRVEVIKPSEVKAILGKKDASKTEIMDYIRTKYDITMKSVGKFEHVADSAVMMEVVLERLKKEIK